MIYAIQAGDDGPIKIGFTVDLKMRLRKLRPDNASSLTVLGIMPGGVLTEEKIHAALADHRREGGEWFDPAPAVMEFIATMQAPDSEIEDVAEVRPGKGVYERHGEKLRKQRAITSDKVDPSKPASIIISDKFGGLTKFCALTGFPTSTAHGWTVSGYIPPSRKKKSVHAHILAVAAKHDIDLDPADFVEKPIAKRRRPRRRSETASAPALANEQ